MNQIKLERLNHTYAKEISSILLTEVKNRALHFVTITGCKITNDLSFAKVYYTVLEEEQKEEIDKELKKAAPFIRSKLASKIDLRHTPELHIIYDDSIDYGKKIEAKIKEIKNEQ